jgi:hypothetical protein
MTDLTLPLWNGLVDARYGVEAGFTYPRKPPVKVTPPTPAFVSSDRTAAVRHYAREYRLAVNAANACQTEADKATTAPAERLHHLERKAQHETRAENAILAILRS